MTTAEQRLVDVDIPLRVIVRIQETPEGHWLWTGARSNGYAIAVLPDHDGISKRLFIHRVLYDKLAGPLEPHERVQRTCKKYGCLNPAHHESYFPEGMSR